MYKRLPEISAGVSLLWLLLFVSSVSSGEFFRSMVIWLPLLLLVNITAAVLAVVGFFHGNHKISIGAMVAAATEFALIFIAIMLGLAAHTL
jgi:hypothetical protein